VGAGLQLSACTAKRCVGSGNANAVADSRAEAKMAHPTLGSIMIVEGPCGQPALELQSCTGTKVMMLHDGRSRPGRSLQVGTIRRAALKIGLQCAAEQHREHCEEEAE
jgi:hypothetical protein